MPSEEERMGMRGPGQGLSPEKAAALREVCGKLERLQKESRGESDGGHGCYKPVAPLAVKVNNVIEQRDELCRLCAEMLATFELPENQEQVALLGEKFPDLLSQWKRRFAKHSGEPGRTRPTVDELEAILNSKDTRNVTILPDGRVAEMDETESGGKQ